MRLIRRRDGKPTEAVLTTNGSSFGLRVLLIHGEPYGTAETDGYLLEDADAAEHAERRRAGYKLRPARAGHA